METIKYPAEWEAESTSSTSVTEGALSLSVIVSKINQLIQQATNEGLTCRRIFLTDIVAASTTYQSAARQLIFNAILDAPADYQLGIYEAYAAKGYALKRLYNIGSADPIGFAISWNPTVATAAAEVANLQSGYTYFMPSSHSVTVTLGSSDSDAIAKAVNYNIAISLINKLLSTSLDADKYGIIYLKDLSDDEKNCIINNSTLTLTTDTNEPLQFFASSDPRTAILTITTFNFKAAAHALKYEASLFTDNSRVAIYYSNTVPANDTHATTKATSILTAEETETKAGPTIAVPNLAADSADAAATASDYLESYLETLSTNIKTSTSRSTSIQWNSLGDRDPDVARERFGSITYSGDSLTVTNSTNLTYARGVQLTQNDTALAAIINTSTTPCQATKDWLHILVDIYLNTPNLLNIIDSDHKRTPGTGVAAKYTRAENGHTTVLLAYRDIAEKVTLSNYLGITPSTYAANSSSTVITGVTQASSGATPITTTASVSSIGDATTFFQYDKNLLTYEDSNQAYFVIEKDGAPFAAWANLYTVDQYTKKTKGTIKCAGDTSYIAVKRTIRYTRTGTKTSQTAPSGAIADTTIPTNFAERTGATFNFNNSEGVAIMDSINTYASKHNNAHYFYTVSDTYDDIKTVTSKGPSEWTCSSQDPSSIAIYKTEYYMTATKPNDNCLSLNTDAVPCGIAIAWGSNCRKKLEDLIIKQAASNVGISS